MKRSQTTRLAIGLWIVFGVVVWNVVFDRILVVEARRYSLAAVMAARRGAPYQAIDDWMQPAMRRGLWTASAAGGGVLLVGLFAIRWADRGARSESVGTESRSSDS